MDLMEVVEVGKEAGYRRALDRIMHELGVPGDLYPANIANAWYIANAALNARVWSPGDEGDVRAVRYGSDRRCE